MRLSEFDFDLPEDLIALRPARPRDSARLLLVDPSAHPDLSDHGVRDLPDLLRPGDVLVFNDTRTIPASLTGLRPARPAGGAAGRDVVVDVTLHKRDAPAVWRAFARPARRLAPGDTVVFADGLSAQVTGRGEGGEVVLLFSCSGAVLDQAVIRTGSMPLPPYIARRRAADADDRSDYQTVYAARDGSVATPTAGLHFTDRLLAALDGRGIERCWITLHVGAGTFLPVKTDDVSAHQMHAEYCEVGAGVASSLNRARREGRRIIAVGTTSLRTLETVTAPDGTVRPFMGETSIFIRPGHRFSSADGLMTNFHLPRSTLMMLVSAFSGVERMRRAYAHAIASGYRFFSYGDASLLWRDRQAAEAMPDRTDQDRGGAG